MTNPKAEQRVSNDAHVVFIENDRLRLGVDLSLGGAVTHLAEHGHPNLITAVRIRLNRQVRPFMKAGNIWAGTPFKAAIASVIVPRSWTIAAKTAKFMSNAYRCTGQWTIIRASVRLKHGTA